jgi:hypothetical protein
MRQQDDTLTTTDETPAPPADTRSKVHQIAELLRGDDGDAGDGAPDETGDEGAPEGGEPETEKRAPKTLAALAETLGVSIDDLYAIEFRDGAEGKGKAHTLGQLKDLLAKETDYTSRELAFQERKVAGENELLRARNELQYVLASLPKGSVPKTVLERAAAEHERVAKLEERRTLDAIPEWKDAAAREKDMDGMAAYIQQYGFGPGDLDRIADHRWRKMIRDSWQRAERVRVALEKVTQEKPKPPGKPAGRSAPQRSAPVGRNAPMTQKVAAISKLLREGK